MFPNDLRAILGAADATIGDDDLLGWDEVGYRHQARHAAPHHQGHAMQRHAPPQHRMSPRQAQAAAAIDMLDAAPGQAEPLVEPLGFSVASFVNAGPTTIKVEAKPQRRFKGSRLFIEANKVGATALENTVFISSIRCGGRELLPSDDMVLASSFVNVAVGAALAWTVQGQGSIISITYVIVGTALAAGAAITVGTQLNGLTVGAQDS